MKRIGILCACEDELAPFLPHLATERTVCRARLRFSIGQIGSVPVAAVFSGVCRVNAAVAAQLLIDDCGVGAVINSGTAGGIAADVRLFDTVVSTQAAYHDVSEGILTEFHPRLPSIWFAADPALLAAARRAAEGKPWVRFGRTVTGEAFIADENRAALSARLSPLSTDMETAGIAHVCFANDIPFLAVRSITDDAQHEGLGTFEQNCRRASERSKDFVLDLLSALAEAAPEK